MKKIIIAAVLAGASFVAYAGPFGLSMGMKKSQIKGLEATGTPFMYTATSVPTPSSQFKTYVMQVGDKNGLCMIKALSDTISTNRYGLALKSKFNLLNEALAKKYGKHKTQDFLMSGSIWNEPEDFMAGLTKDERYLRTYWDAEEQSTLSGNLKAIMLVASGLGHEKGVVYIQYEFENSEKCDAERKALDAGAL